MSDQLELRYIPLSTVRRWDRNPKKHDMGALAASIERYGFKDPPAFDPSLNTGTGGIVEGNGRAECLTWMKQQKKHAPRGVLVDKDEWLIPVLFGVDAPSQAAAEAYGVDHNNLTMSGGDFTALDMSKMWGDGFADVLSSLADMGELPITFDADDLLSLISTLPEPGGGGDEFDATPEEGETRTHLGELWSIGGVHRLYVGDCTIPDNVARLMGNQRARAMVTDSPYGIEQEGIPNDDPEGLRALFDGMLAVLPMDDGVVVNFQSTRLFPVWIDALRAAGQKFERMLWMYKAAQNTYPWRGWLLKSEAIPVSTKGVGGWNDHHPYAHDCYYLSEVSGEIPEGLGWHASVKPMSVVIDIVQRVSSTDDIVYDPFLGSGTGIVSCHRTGRRCYGMEIAPRYADVILRRAEAEGLECELVDG